MPFTAHPQTSTMANRSQGATAAAAAAGDNGHDDDGAVVCLDGTTATEGLSSLYTYVPTQDEIRTSESL